MYYPLPILSSSCSKERREGGGGSDAGFNIPTNQTNFATSSQAELDQHDCLSLMELEVTAISPVKEAPIVDTKNLFVVDPGTIPRMVSHIQVMRSQWRVTLRNSHISAQEAELWALERACKVHQGQRINVYADSRYDFAGVWL